MAIATNYMPKILVNHFVATEPEYNAVIRFWNKFAFQNLSNNEDRSVQMMK